MGAAAGQRPTVQCPQGHVNPAGRQFCQICGRRITASDSPPESQQPLDEVQRLTSLLASSQQENRRLQDEVTALKSDFESAKVNAAAAVPHGLIAELEAKLKDAEQRATAAEPHILDLKQRWQAAVEKVGSLEGSLAASLRELDVHKAQLASQQKKDDSGGQTGAGRKWIILVTMMTILGGAIGFGVDRVMIPSRSEAQTSVSQLKTQIAEQQGNIQKLTAQLNSVTQEAAAKAADLSEQTAAREKAETERNDAAARVQKLTTQLNTATHDAAAKAADLSAETAARKKAEAERNEAAAAVRQSQGDANRLASLSARYPGARFPENTHGVLRWEGDIKTDKGVNVVIDHGVAVIANHDGTSLSVSGDALPGVPVVVQPTSKNVYILEAPRKDQWNRVVFHIDKKGHASVQLTWTVL
jgi:hypothetical protein